MKQKNLNNTSFFERSGFAFFPSFLLELLSFIVIFLRVFSMLLLVCSATGIMQNNSLIIVEKSMDTVNQIQKVSVSSLLCKGEITQEMFLHESFVGFHLCFYQNIFCTNFIVLELSSNQYYGLGHK